MRLKGFIETVVLGLVSLRCMAQELHQVVHPTKKLRFLQ